MTAETSRVPEGEEGRVHTHCPVCGVPTILLDGEHRPHEATWAELVAARQLARSTVERLAAIEAERQEMARRIDALQGVCAEAYQLAGTLDAPTLALDKLSSAASGKPIPGGTYLPVQPTDWQVRAEKAERRLAEAEAACGLMREALAAYANPESWIEGNVVGWRVRWDGPDDYPNGPDLARAALAADAGARVAAVLAAARAWVAAYQTFDAAVETEVAAAMTEAHKRLLQAELAEVAAVEALGKEAT